MKLDVVYRYVDDVLAGEVLACKWHRLAVERFVHDLRTVGDRGFRFDEDAAQRRLDFFPEVLRHSKGEWAGQPFELAPWQAFTDINVYGWVDEEGRRRFRTVYEEVARKNGKTTRLAGTGLYGLFAEGEAGAEVYAAATKRDQAMRTFREACSMVRKSPILSRHLEVAGSVKYPRRIYDMESESWFDPLGQDSDTEDGLNVYYALIDEYHAHKTSGMYDVLDTGTGSRRQPLVWVITTAGVDVSGPCYELRQYTRQVLQGFDKPDGVRDDSHYGIIFTLDGYDERVEESEKDDWRDPRVWVKANPNLGVSVHREDLERKLAKATEMPRARNNFLTKHMNIWTSQSILWMNMEKWYACKTRPVTEESLYGRYATGGLDLAKVLDLAALVLVAGGEDDVLDVFCRFWCPEAAIQKPSHRGSDAYRAWAEEGLIVPTPGEVIDYDFIERDILDLYEKIEIVDLAFDRWNSSQLVQSLQNEGLELTGFGQGYASMNAPMNEVERLVVAGLLNHGSNPVLSWMASNLQAREDPAGNVKPDKAESKKAIDGMTALFMAVGRWMEADVIDEGTGLMVVSA